MDATVPALSVIIPTLNEAATLPLLLADLAAQRGVSCEVLVSDGGSADGTALVAAQALARLGLAGAVIEGSPGRGRQLNRGAARARAEWLLFLHADSRLPDPTALGACLERLCGAQEPNLAGRFTLAFDLPPAERGFGYFFCEVKARLGLPGTIHGDQGFWLRRAFFRELGGFREDLPVLEDTRLAEAVRTRGRWLLLPATIVTSPRRFRAEGFVERQTLNALLMNFTMTGWDEPLLVVPEIYRSQDRARPLRLAPVYRLLDGLLQRLPRRKRLSLWCRTGAFVRANAWQLKLWPAARAAFAAGQSPAALPLEPVQRFQRRFDLLTDHRLGHLLAAALTWLWFRSRARQGG